MKTNFFDSWHLPQFRGLRTLDRSAWGSVWAIIAFVIGLPLSLALAAYLIDAMVSMLVR